MVSIINMLLCVYYRSRSSWFVLTNGTTFYSQLIVCMLFMRAKLYGWFDDSQKQNTHAELGLPQHKLTEWVDHMCGVFWDWFNGDASTSGGFTRRRLIRNPVYFFRSVGWTLANLSGHEIPFQPGRWGGRDHFHTQWHPSAPDEVWCWWREEAYHKAYMFVRVQSEHCFERRRRTYGFGKLRTYLWYFWHPKILPRMMWSMIF